MSEQLLLFKKYVVLQTCGTDERSKTMRLASEMDLFFHDMTSYKSSTNFRKSLRAESCQAGEGFLLVESQL